MKRKEYIDYLRVFATFAVIVIHVAAAHWYAADVRSIEWQTYNFYDSIVRWGVSIFTMISGALFLSRDIPIKKIYSKYILKMLIAFIFWTIIYTVLSGLAITQNGISFTFSSSRITSIINGYYHMWYILMIIGLYMGIPIFKKIVEDKKIMKYFLILSFIFAFAIPWCFKLIIDFISNQAVLNVVNALNANVSTMKMNLVLGYSFFFVLGYYISTTEISKKQRKIIYTLSVIGFISTIVLSSYVSIKFGSPIGKYYDDFSVNVLFEAIGLFVLFKHKSYNRPKINEFISKLSKYSFGVYLVHVLVIEKLEVVFNISASSYFSLISVLAVSLLVGFISLVISYVLNHIPVIKKYCV